MDIQPHLDRIAALFEEELTDNLVGIYLHGSVAMGCYHKNSSDIDFLVVVAQQLSEATKRKIVSIALTLHEEIGSVRGIEFSVIVEHYLKSFVYPTPFELHYSDSHRERYITDESYLCGGYEDQDLAAHITVAYYRGITLYGLPLSELYAPIDRSFYVDAMLYDMEDVRQVILDNPVYFTLNLCRIVMYLSEGTIASKREGGEWGMNTLPHQYRLLVQQCLEHYNEGTSARAKYEVDVLREYSDYMMREIRGLLSADGV
ncbi:aminoglycoside adenylyltransferase domain-containing protein [Paenibacillus taiwanensis]|uniref:aminoglycoside adenylyltransferase domain-containing protein n=1 Tax=Paenibacillus taiwanensis TaxID=401638 RepID=UPI0003F6487A|nr:aminoglycoside adenylyltransferase domain-containing protein [Paenibacillus taiwanensis]